MDKINFPYLQNVFTSDWSIKIFKYQMQPHPDLSSKCCQRDCGVTMSAPPELDGLVTFQVRAAEVPQEPTHPEQD